MEGGRRPILTAFSSHCLSDSASDSITVSSSDPSASSTAASPAAGGGGGAPEQSASPSDFAWLYSLIWSSPELPHSLPIYPHQIGGHGLKSAAKLDVLHDPANHIIYKPVQQIAKGQSEINFYEAVLHQCEQLTPLRDFVPRFFGCVTSLNISNTANQSAHPISVSRKHSEQRQLEQRQQSSSDWPECNLYMAIEDLLATIAQPAVMDIKIGRVGHEPNAPPQKIRNEAETYPHRAQIGFMIIGIKKCFERAESGLFIDRYHGRALDPESVLRAGIAPFFQFDYNRPHSHAHRVSRQLCVYFISQLDRLIDEVFSRQTAFHFVGCSLLFAYDTRLMTTSSSAEMTETGEMDSEQNDGAERNTESIPPGSALIKLIDFAHVLPGRNKLDENFLYGLVSLRSYLKILIKN